MKCSNSAYEYKYFKLVKLSIDGDKIGYYNTDLDPETSWPTKDVDLAIVLTKEQVKSIMTIEKMKNKLFNTNELYQIQSIGVY